MTTAITRRTSPFAEMLQWLESGSAFGGRAIGLAPSLRIEDFVEEGVYVLRAEMPGIDPDKDVELVVEGGMVTIRGERREEHRDKNLHELHYGSFSRSVPLPRDVKPEEIAATYTDGVLEVRIPLGATEEEARRIPVQRTER